MYGLLSPDLGRDRRPPASAKGKGKKAKSSKNVYGYFRKRFLKFCRPCRCAGWWYNEKTESRSTSGKSSPRRQPSQQGADAPAKSTSIFSKSTTLSFFKLARACEFAWRNAQPVLRTGRGCLCRGSCRGRGGGKRDSVAASRLQLARH